MTPLAIARFLIGDRDAIVRLAASRWSLAVGAILVFSASLARNYDGKALPVEGEALLHGIGVSIGNAFILFSLFYLVALAKLGPQPRPPFIRGYLAFLGLFWLTSPMAWLYAIPYERILSPIEAIDANLWTLALVSLWRVLLMMRVLSVLWQTRPIPTFVIIALYGDALIFIASQLMKAPVFDFMGGLQHSPEEQHLASIKFATGVWSCLAAPVLLIAALVSLRYLRPVWSLDTNKPDERPSWGLFASTAAAILLWIPALGVTQPEQHNRLHAEQFLRSDRVGEAFAFMAAKGRENFPPVWDPPPRVGFMDKTPDAAAIRAVLVNYNARDWVSELYFKKHWRMSFHHHRGPPDMTADDVNRHYQYDDSLTDAERACFTFHANHDPSLTPHVRAVLRDVLAKNRAKDESSFFEDPP
jgi:hypothetical protein